MATKRQLEKTTVYLLFSLFIQILAIDYKLITMTTRIGGEPVFVGEL